MGNKNTRSLVKSIPKRESRREHNVDDLVIHSGHEINKNHKLNRLRHFGSFYLGIYLKVLAYVQPKGREKIINCSLSVMGSF